MPASEEEWQKKLSPAQYEVLRKKGTEPPFTGKLLHNTEKGIYTCGACGAELFSSDTKFESGTGWPSFFAPISERNVAERPDTNHGIERTEVTCPKCGSHLGHVFDDGPKTLPDGRQATGRRYCVNSEALGFKAGEAPKP